MPIKKFVKIDKNKVKIDPQKYVYQGSPYNAYKNSKNIDNELGSPLYYLQKLQKHRTNSVLMGNNYNATFVEKHQNRPSEIRLSGSPPLLCRKTQKKLNELFFDGRKLKRERCRKTSK